MNVRKITILCSLFTLSSLLLIPSLIYAETIKFAVIGDFGDDTTEQGLLADDLEARKSDIDFIITTGDNRYSGAGNFETAVGKYYCSFLNDVKSGGGCDGGDATINRFFPSLGNHDYRNGGGLTEYLDYFTLPGEGIATTDTSGTEKYYDFIIGPVHFFAIDTDDFAYNSSEWDEQKQWLEDTMKASTTPWQVVYGHHPPYGSKSVSAIKWPFQPWGADIMFAGHQHVYRRTIVNDPPDYVDFPLIISAIAGGRPDGGSVGGDTKVVYDSKVGATYVTANETSMEMEFITYDGDVIDTYTLGDPAPTPEVSPTIEPTIEPTVEPTVEPTIEPTPTPGITITSNFLMEYGSVNSDYDLNEDLIVNFMDLFK